MEGSTRSIKRNSPLDDPVSCVALAVATPNLSARIRSRGLSARENITARQLSDKEIPLLDQDIILKQSRMSA